MSSYYNVLIGSTIRQKPEILKEFLQSLQELDKKDLKVSYLFINDNDIRESGDLLKNFQKQKNKVIIIQGEQNNQYICDETKHHWQENLIWKVADYKDKILSYARENKYDYVFLVDSDLVLHPLTLTHLISTRKNIISEIFWTKWKPDIPPLPQVWVSDQYEIYYRYRQESLTQDEVQSRINGFLNCLKIPGIYEVGGLGACTLISQKALSKGVSFKEIKNISFWGEDRHFCIRASCMGLKLFVDTHYPAYHIYRESELEGVKEYKEKSTQLSYDKNCLSFRSNMKAQNNKITLSMLVRNEAKRYLPQVLEQAVKYIDQAVILDDASEDNTVEVCKQILNKIPLTIVSNSEPMFNNEIILRKQLWEMTVKTNPDWILCLDADELFEDKAVLKIPLLINQPYYDYYAFRLYDFWDDYHYREDKYWQAHKYYRIFLIRYQPNFPYLWKKTPLHCGRFPVNVNQLPGAVSSLRVKHLGWKNPLERIKKYHNYLALDPEGKYGSLEQYTSILDPNPNLIKWEE